MLRKEILNGELTDEHTHQLKVPRIPELAFISLSLLSHPPLHV